MIVSQPGGDKKFTSCYPYLMEKMLVTIHHYGRPVIWSDNMYRIYTIWFRKANIFCSFNQLLNTC